MTGAEVLALAASRHVRVALARGDLLLEADDEPPAEALVALRDHKEAVVSELRKWRRLFEAHIATVMRMRGLSRFEAERAAYEIVLIERLNSTHPDTSSDRCAYCSKLETPGATLLAIGWGARHAWLHSGCWELWRERRRTEAIAALVAPGIVKPSGDAGETLARKALGLGLKLESTPEQ